MKPYEPFKCRASSVGSLMTRMNGETFGKGTVDVLLSDVIYQGYGYYKEIDAKQMNKGNAMEAEAIELVGLLTATKVIKNTEFRSNKWFTGTCDILTSTAIRDTKCSWSIDTFPLTYKEAEKTVRSSGYDWQLMIYMMLWGLKVGYVDFLLMPTPRDLLMRNDDEFIHIDLVNKMPLDSRLISVRVDYDPDWITKAKDRVNLVQDTHLEYFKRIVGSV